MDCRLNISSRMFLGGIEQKLLSVIPAECLDYLYKDTQSAGGIQRNIISIHSKNKLPKEKLINIISDWIDENYKEFILNEIMEGLINEGVINPENKDEILKCALCESPQYKCEIFYEDLKKKLTHYMQSESELNLDGFIRFRLKEYRNDAEFILSEAIDSFFAKKEYELFISLMQRYVETQPPLVELIHICPSGNGYELFDFAKRSINVKCEEEYGQNSETENLSEEDKLMSVLLVLTPRRIIWHKTKHFRDINFFKTLGSIFKNRFSVCEGCEICDRFK